jgi:hypothetical protein
MQRLSVGPTAHIRGNTATGGGSGNNAIQSGSASPDQKGMMVCVRVRPLSQKELDAGIRNCCQVINGSIVAIRKEGSGGYLKSEQPTINGELPSSYLWWHFTYFDPHMPYLQIISSTLPSEKIPVNWRSTRARPRNT